LIARWWCSASGVQQLVVSSITGASGMEEQPEAWLLCAQGSVDPFLAFNRALDGALGGAQDSEALDGGVLRCAGKELC